MIKNIIQVLQSGFSRRWHNNVDMADKADDLAQHQWSVAMIVLHLDPNASRELIIEALTHDVGEYIAGDLAYDFKLNHENLTLEHKAAEEGYRQKFVKAQVINEEDVVTLKCADWLSSYMWVAKHNPNLLDRADWRQQISYFYEEVLNNFGKKKADSIFQPIFMIRAKGYCIKPDFNWVFGKGLKEYDTTD